MKIDFNTHSRGISRLEKWVWASCSMENHGEIEKEAAALAKPTSVLGYALCNQIVRDGGSSLQWWCHVESTECVFVDRKATAASLTWKEEDTDRSRRSLAAVASRNQMTTTTTMGNFFSPQNPFVSF